MESFEDECLRRMIEERRKDPNNPAAGIGFALASVFYRRCQRELEEKNKIYFITINPKPSICLRHFKQKVDKYFAKYPGTQYAFEIRHLADEDNYAGIHCHVIMSSLNKKNDASTLKRNLLTSFKDYVGNNKHIDVRLYPASYREDKVAYLKGEKWDDSKFESVEYTKQWRRVNDLENLYTV